MAKRKTPAPLCRNCYWPHRDPKGEKVQDHTCICSCCYSKPKLGRPVNSKSR